MKNENLKMKRYGYIMKHVYSPNTLIAILDYSIAGFQIPIWFYYGEWQFMPWSNPLFKYIVCGR